MDPPLVVDGGVEAAGSEKARFQRCVYASH